MMEKEKPVKKYQIILDEEQVRVMLSALDLYSRIGSGQLEKVVRLRIDDLIRGGEKIPDDFYANAEYFLKGLKCLFWNLSLHAAHSIGSSAVPKSYRLAYEILQVVRRHLAFEEKPEGGFDSFLKVTDHPFRVEIRTMVEKEK